MYGGTLLLIDHDEEMSDNKKALAYKGLAIALEEYAEHITVFESSTSTNVQVTEDKRSNGTHSYDRRHWWIRKDSRAYQNSFV